MKLEQNNVPMLFSKTEIADIFFIEYLSELKGDYVKLYLYILFLSKYNKDVKLNDLSKKLNISLKEIQTATQILEELGLITKKPTGFILNNLHEIELHKLYSPKLTSTDTASKSNEKNKKRSKAIENINSLFFNGVMSPSWYNDIDFWFSKYNFDEQVMIALFGYCFEKSSLNKNYVQSVANTWAANNIKDFNDLDIYSANQDKFNSIKKTICKKLGLFRTLTEYEESYLTKWLNEYKYNLEIIELALKKTTSKSNPNFDYINKILTDWNDRNLRTVDEVKNFLINSKQKDKLKKDIEKKSNYNNYEQRDYNNLDSLYANIKENV